MFVRLGVAVYVRFRVQHEVLCIPYVVDSLFFGGNDEECYR